jgi:ribosome-binding protein aMBF1 (putative translation factor)
VPKPTASEPSGSGGKRAPKRLEKTIYSTDYAAVLRLLREAREAAGVTQVDLAERLGQTQSFVSKIERGDRRLDIIQLRTILAHVGMTLPQFVERLEKALLKRT